MIGVDGAALRRYTVNRTFLVRKFDHFFLTSEAFRALPLHARELVFIKLFTPLLLLNATRTGRLLVLISA